MNREIKFRAWDKEEKRMVNVIESIYFPLNKPSGKDICYDEKNNGWDNENEPHYRGWLYDYELMQFTGLLDKNGKEIWEKDILCCYDESLSEVVYNHEVKLPDFYREIWSSKIVDGLWLPADDGEICGGVEVIGNIYENPSLLTN